MHKYIIIFFWATLNLASCKHAQSDQSVIKRDQMVSILTDLHIVDGGMYNSVSVNPDTLYKYGTARYLALFKRHHVDSSMFRRSLKYYTGKPVELQAMYDEILKNLAAKTDSANKSMFKKNNAGRPNAE
jgi:hypothetical protein